MTIALIAHDSKKELMVQFCTAYCRILSQHKLVATGTTGKLIAEATGLQVQRFLAGVQGGELRPGPGGFRLLGQRFGVQQDALDPQRLGGFFGSLCGFGLLRGKAHHGTHHGKPLLLQDAHRHGRLGAAVHLHQDLVLALVGVKPAAGQKCVVHVPCLPPCALLWATASWSQRSFSGWPAWPLTQTYVMVCLASCSSACAQRSGFRAGEPSDFFQPRRFQPLAQPFCSPLMTYWLSEQ